jgi:hypothetical protein
VNRPSERARLSEWRKEWRAGSWTAALCFIASAALADPRPRVAIEGPLDNRIVIQLAGELRASGFIVQTRPAGASRGPPRGDAASDTDAVIRVSAEAVEVWSIPPGAHASGAPEAPEVIPIAGADEAHAAVAALRAEEVVRARLLPIDRPNVPDSASPSATPFAAPPAAPLPSASSAGAPRAAAGESASPAVAPVASAFPSVAPSPAIARATPPDARLEPARAGLDAGALLLLTPGGIDPAVEVLVMPRWMPIEHATIRGLVAVPLLSPTLTSHDGTASATEWLFGASVEWHVLPREAPWSVHAGAGSGAARLQTWGTAYADFTGASGDAWTWMAFVSVGGSGRLGSARTRLGADVLVGMTLPKVAVQFPDRAIAWGQPWVGLALTLQVDAL